MGASHSNPEPSGLRMANLARSMTLTKKQIMELKAECAVECSLTNTFITPSTAGCSIWPFTSIISNQPRPTIIGKRAFSSALYDCDNIDESSRNTLRKLYNGWNRAFFNNGVNYDHFIIGISVLASQSHESLMNILRFSLALCCPSAEQMSEMQLLRVLDCINITANIVGDTPLTRNEMEEICRNVFDNNKTLDQDRIVSRLIQHPLVIAYVQGPATSSSSSRNKRHYDSNEEQQQEIAKTTTTIPLLDPVPLQRVDPFQAYNPCPSPHKPSPMTPNRQMLLLSPNQVVSSQSPSNNHRYYHLPSDRLRLSTRGGFFQT